MNIVIYNTANKERFYEVRSNEQPTLFQSLVSVLERFEIPVEPIRDWINKKKEGHVYTEVQGEKYTAILIP